MTRIATNYARVLYELGVDRETVSHANEIMNMTPELLQCLISPVISLPAKMRVIERVFPNEIQSTLKVMCCNRSVSLFREVNDAYEDLYDETHHIGKATMYCATKPDQETIKQFQHFLAKKYRKKTVRLKIKKQKDLIGGFVLRVKDEEYDWSLKGRLDDLEQKLVRR